HLPTRRSSDLKLNTVTYNLGHVNALAIFILIVSGLNSAINTYKTAFFHILVNVFRLFTESNTVYKIRTTFTILSCKRTIDSQIESCNRYIVLTDRSEEHTSELQSRFDLVC